jgi:hypothetical protein
MLERLTIGTFADHLNETFRVYPDAERFVEMALVEATDLSTGAGNRPDRRAPFSIVFRGPAAPVLRQRIYRLEHAGIGTFDVFMVAIGPVSGGMRYEVIFT